MRTYTLLFLVGLLPLAATAQSPTVFARGCAFNNPEAIFDSGEGAVPQARSKIASPAKAQAREDGSSPAKARAREDGDGMASAMRVVLLANCPKGMAEADWLKLMESPENRTLYPLRITQGMLDTLDMRQLDPGFYYMMAR
jgi:hypothetical protein